MPHTVELALETGRVVVREADRREVLVVEVDVGRELVISRRSVDGVVGRPVDRSGDRVPVAHGVELPRIRSRSGTLDLVGRGFLVVGVEPNRQGAMVRRIDVSVDGIVHLVGFEFDVSADIDVVDARRGLREVGRSLVTVERTDGTADEIRVHGEERIVPMGAQRLRRSIVHGGIHVADQDRGNASGVVHLFALDEQFGALRARRGGQRSMGDHHEELLVVELVGHHGAGGDAVITQLVPTVAHFVGRGRNPEEVFVAELEPIGIVGDARRLAAGAVLRIAAHEPPFVAAALLLDEGRQLVPDRSVGLLEAEDVPFVFDDRLGQHRAAVGPQVVARALARNPEVVTAERERLLGDVRFARGGIVLVVLVVEYRFEIVGASGGQGAKCREQRENY